MLSVLVTMLMGMQIPFRKQQHRHSGRNPYIVKNITQPVDHQNHMNSDVFHQRYLVNDTAWVKGGPIFVNTAAEGGDIEEVFWNYESYFNMMYDMGGLLIFAEHRYFGKSFPYGTAEESLKNSSTRIGYLSTSQSMEDNIALIKYIKKQYKSVESPVITFGGSLSGTLAGISRIRYPDAVDAALCSSSPLQGFLDIKNFSEYGWMERVTNNWEFLSPGCADIVRTGFSYLLSSNASNVASVFNTCESPDSETISTIYGMVSGILQSNAEFIYPPHASTIPADCKRMSLGSELSIFANLLLVKDVPCLNLTKYRNGGNKADARAWSYLSCTEIIHPIGSNNVSDMFPINKWTPSSLSEWCFSVFGSHISVNPMLFPTLYGLYDLKKLYKTTSRIIWAYGTLDPWATMGMPFEGSTDLLPVIRIVNGSHCADAGASRPDDGQDMINAREMEKKIIQQWVADISVEKKR